MSDLTMTEREQAILALDGAIATLATARHLLARMDTDGAPEPAAAQETGVCPHPLTARHQVASFGADGPVFCNACGEQVE